MRELSLVTRPPSAFVEPIDTPVATSSRAVFRGDLWRRAGVILTREYYRLMQQLLPFRPQPTWRAVCTLSTAATPGAKRSFAAKAEA